MQMFQSAADLGGVELDPVPLEARRAHVVDVKLQVSAVHDGQHQAQGVFGLVRVRQAHLRATVKRDSRAGARRRRRQNVLLCSIKLTTNLLLTFSRICFSFRAMDSPFLFFILFFSSFLQAYILPVALTWQAHT